MIVCRLYNSASELKNTKLEKLVRRSISYMVQHCCSETWFIKQIDHCHVWNKSLCVSIMKVSDIKQTASSTRSCDSSQLPSVI